MKAKGTTLERTPSPSSSEYLYSKPLSTIIIRDALRLSTPNGRASRCVDELLQIVRGLVRNL